MISQRKIEANRRNAAKSTGPRTAEGKDKVRFNAVTHGFTATTVVLPHEDEEAYRQRLEDWTRELNAPGKLGHYLVERVVKISWQLDRADTSEQAHLAKRIEEAPRLFDASQAETVETLFARLLGIKPQTTTAVQEPVHARGPRRAGKAGSGLVDSPAFLLRELESSSQGCRRLMDEWTRLLEWSERLGSGGLPTQDISSKLQNLQHAVRLLGLRIADTGAAAALTAEPLAASFLQAWLVVERQAPVEQEAEEMDVFMEQDDDEDDDLPDETEPPFAVMYPYWAAAGVPLSKLAAEWCGRLRTLIAGYEQSEAEARARLALEASFDDSAEGERVHRYQARWGRALLKTLGEIHELRERGEAIVGPESPPVEDWMSRACMRLAAEESERRESFERAEEPSGGEECVRDVTSDVATPTCDEPSASEAGTSQGSSPRQKENVQNKPTAERSTVLHKGFRSEAQVESKAAGEHWPVRESHDSVDKSEGDEEHAVRILAPCRPGRPRSVLLA